MQAFQKQAERRLQIFDEAIIIKSSQTLSSALKICLMMKRKVVALYRNVHLHSKEKDIDAREKVKPTKFETNKLGFEIWFTKDEEEKVISFFHWRQSF